MSRFLWAKKWENKFWRIEDGDVTRLNQPSEPIQVYHVYPYGSINNPIIVDESDQEVINVDDYDSGYES